MGVGVVAVGRQVRIGYSLRRGRGNAGLPPQSSSANIGVTLAACSPVEHKRQPEEALRRVARIIRVWGTWLILAIGWTMLVPDDAAAQARVVLEGRVIEANGPGIEEAVVRLEGQRPIMTTAGGHFRFDGVELGPHRIQVSALGYVPFNDTILVNRDGVLIISLEIAPFVLDSLVVDVEEVGLSGQVREARRGRSLPGADVRTSQGHVTQTDNRGRFRFDAWAGVPIQILIRAFGYLPVDTVVVPAKGGRFTFDLAEDSLVTRMIGVELRRLEERAGGHMAITMRPLNREDLLRWSGASLKDVLRVKFPVRRRRIRCVVVDEKALTPEMTPGVLDTTLAQDVERMEFLFRGAMLRVYTREFMRTMLGSGIRLRRPLFVEMAHPPLCA